MLLLKEEIVEMLRDNGDLATAQQAESKLPDQVDSDSDDELLRELGIDVEYLLRMRSRPS